MKLRNVLVINKIGYDEGEKKAYAAVVQILRKHKIMFRVISLLEVHPAVVQNRDLIIIVGGDGTFLKTAHAVQDNIPFLCINPNPGKTEGFFSRTLASSAEKKIIQIRAGKIKPKQLWRLQATINNVPVEPCMNEYYVGEQKPYHVAKYYLKMNGKSEMQKSSGLLVNTAAGSTAWCRSAGGKVMPITKKEFQFVVRDPYIGRIRKTRIKKGILQKNAVVHVTAVSENMILISDAVGKEHSVPKNSSVIIKQSEKPVLLFY